MDSASSDQFTFFLRPRNFQWYVKLTPLLCDLSTADEWEKYADIENEIIEDAYSVDKDTVEIDGGHIINLKHLLQFSGTDDSVGRQVKRVKLDTNNCEDVKLRHGRFFSPVEYSLPETPHSTTNEDNAKHDNFIGSSLISAYYNLEIDGKKKTTADVVEGAAAGIIEEGRAVGQANQAQWLARKLLDVKQFGENIPMDILEDFAKPEQENNIVDENYLSRVPSIIGKMCVYIYTRDSFWYKSVNAVLRNDLVKITREQIKTLGPFCNLLSYHLHKHHTTGTRMVYRGLNLTDAERKRIIKKDIITFKSFTSTSRNRELAEWYGDTLLIIDTKVFDDVSRYHDGCGTDISAVSQFPEEEEFLISPGQDFHFVKYEFDSVNGKHIIYLKSMVIVE